MINKTIHYCWFGRNPFPPLVEKCIDSWQLLLPDFQIKRWDEKNSPIENNYVKKALREKQYAFASDYVRLYALYNEGGVYLDTDMEIIKDLSPLLDCDFFAGYEKVNKDYISSGILGAKPALSILSNIMTEMESFNHFETIPKIMTPHIEKSLKENILKLNIYDHTYFYPYNPFDDDRKRLQLFHSDIKEETYAIHHWNASWKMSFKNRLLKKINTLTHKRFRK